MNINNCIRTDTIVHNPKLALELLMGQIKVGFPLVDKEEYRSTACVPHDVRNGRCYASCAYNAYSNGFGCGMSGSITVHLGGDVEIVQRNGDMARVQDVGDGIPPRLACMDQKRLSRWSLCVVRVCTDGKVWALRGTSATLAWART
jgi:hypothetical protein